MPPIINFKTCDNSPECSGISSCPTGALAWDKEKKTIVIIPEKCTGCLLCVNACPVKAIKFANTSEDEARIKEEFDEEGALVGELFIDRYGAMPIGPSAGYREVDIDTQKLSCGNIAVVELFDADDLECLRASVPIKNILGKDIVYSKVRSDGSRALSNKFGISQLPALLFFKGGILMGKIEGYYDTDKESVLKALVNEIIKNS